MSDTPDRDLRFAILIDADNVSEKYVQIVLDEVANFGVATYKRIYGDWTTPRLASWKTCLLDNSITPMQQYSYTYGKNSTDSAMIIDAMDILYSGHVDGFAIVSSDSDFTRLVMRLRESGMQVVGMGEQKTPKPFISACNQFKYLDLLYAASKQDEADEEDAEGPAEQPEGAPGKRRRRRGGRRRRKAAPAEGAEPVDAADAPAVAGEGDGADGAGEAEGAEAARTQPRRRPGDRGAALDGAADASAAADEEEPLDDAFDGEGEADFEDAEDLDDADIEFGELSRAEKRRRLKSIRLAVSSIIDTFSDDDGWVSLGQLGDQLRRRMPDFDVRNYGYKRLHPFLKSLGVYEFEEPSGESGRRQIYLREK